MKITILNGNDPDRNPDFDGCLGRVESRLAVDHQVDRLDLKSMNIHSCRGCFGCWQKTPGKCLVPDDMEQVYGRYIRSDLVFFASPLWMGFTSWILKQAVERLLPLIHPYVELHRGKLRHRPRYEKYPNLGLLLAGEPDKDSPGRPEADRRVALSGTRPVQGPVVQVS